MRIGVLFGFFFGGILISCAQDKPNQVTIPDIDPVVATPYVTGVETPWGLAFLPNGDLLITDRSGVLYRFDGSNKLEISGVPEVYSRGQGGLLDIAVHPEFQKNSLIFMTLSSPEGGNGAHTALVRARLENDQLVDVKTLYKATPNTTKGQHFGSRIYLDGKGKVYFSIGERGEQDINPQDTSKDGGKIYRLNEDGSIPKDNPLYGVPGAKQAIYSFGHRNPQGLIFHPERKELWNTEHGPRGGDELNIVRKGANYGWPVITYGINYSGTPITDKTEEVGMEQPIYYWVPSIAPSSLCYIDSPLFPEWKGDLLVGSLSFQYLEYLDMDGDKVVGRLKLLADIGRVRSVVQGPDGAFYIGVESKGVYRVTPRP